LGFFKRAKYFLAFLKTDMASPDLEQSRPNNRALSIAFLPVPEVDPKSKLYDKGNFCYAGKEHIEFSRDKILVVTYVCNSADDMQSQTSFLRRNLFLYRPVVKEISY